MNAHLILSAAALTLAACAPTATDAGPAAPAEAPCTLTVTFGSYAMGIDRGAFETVDTLLRADGAVTTVDRRPWGREGEVTLCATVRSPADAQRLFDTIRPLIPARPRGPITVETAAGARFEVSNPQ